MPVTKSVLQSNFRGVNDARHPALIADGELVSLINYFSIDGRLRQRPPMTLYKSTGGTYGAITGAIGLTDDVGAWDFITLHQTGLENYDPVTGTGTDLTDAMTLAPATSDVPWRVEQYKNYGYAVRPNLNYIVRFDDTSFWSTGIAAPSTGAVGVTSATAGNVEAGDYYGVFTFVDADGVESPPSPVSAKWTQGASKKVDWSSVDVSTNPRVVARNLYRTLPNQTGEYFFVHQIADNTSTTATEDTTVPQMGDLVDQEKTVPPVKNWIDIAVCFERLWVTDGRFVYGSNPEDPDSWSDFTVYSFNPDDGQPIVAIRRVGTSLLVVKTNSVWALDQSLGEFEFLPRVVDEKNGGISTLAVSAGDGRLFLYSGEAVLMTDGRSPCVDISTPKLTYFRTIPDANKSNAVGGFYSKYGWYVIGLTDDGIAVNRTPQIWVYDLRQNNWFRIATGKKAIKPISTFWFDADMPIFLAEVIDTYGVQHLYGNFTYSGGTLQRALIDIFSSGDPGANTGDISAHAGYWFALVDAVGSTEYRKIDSTIQFKGLNFGVPGYLHSLSRLQLSANSIGTAGSETCTLKVYQDRGTSAYKTRTGLALNTLFDWHNFSLSTRGRKSALSIVELTRSSIYDMDVSAAEFFGEAWNWRPKEGT